MPPFRHLSAQTPPGWAHRTPITASIAARRGSSTWWVCKLRALARVRRIGLTRISHPLCLRPAASELWRHGRSHGQSGSLHSPRSLKMQTSVAALQRTEAGRPSLRHKLASSCGSECAANPSRVDERMNPRSISEVWQVFRCRSLKPPNRHDAGAGRHQEWPMSNG